MQIYAFLLQGVAQYLQDIYGPWLSYLSGLFFEVSPDKPSPHPHYETPC